MKLNTEIFLKELEELVNIESPSHYPEGVQKIAIWFKSKLEKLGWHTELINVGSEVGPCLKATNKPTEQYDILLLGHMDTVFPQGTTANWPFSIQGDKVTGPGVSDMKGGLLYIYHAVKYFTENNLLNDSAICVLFNSDEEIGTTYSRSLVESIAQKSSAVLVLEPGRSNGAYVNARKGVGQYNLEFQGIAAHAGVAPQNGASALLEMFNWGIELSKLTDFNTGLTVNFGIAKGGTATNVVPEQAYAQVDLRISEPTQADIVDQKIKELLSNPFNPKVKTIVTGGVNRPPMTTDAKTLKLCETVTELGKKIDLPVVWVATGGGSDGNFTSGLGIPTLDAMGPIGCDMHSHKETADIPSLNPRFNLLLDTIKHLLK